MEEEEEGVFVKPSMEVSKLGSMTSSGSSGGGTVTHIRSLLFRAPLDLFIKGVKDNVEEVTVRDASIADQMQRRESADVG